MMKTLRHAACVLLAAASFVAAPAAAGNLPAGSACTNSWECAGDSYCLGSPPQCRAIYRAPANAPNASTPSGETISAETSIGTQTTAKAAIDPRLNELQKRFSALLEQARARKITYLKAARLYRERFNDLFPEQASNDLMNEYLAYTATVGERVDKKKLTEAEAEYELARKMSELRDRALAREAPRREEVARRASDEASVKRANEQAAIARAELEQRRIAQDRDLAERRAAQEREWTHQQEQAEKERKRQEMMTLGLQLLLGPRLAASQPPPAEINITVQPAPPPAPVWTSRQILGH
jgi:hypothetical protein